MRQFESGATRNTDDNKHDYEGFLSYPVIRRFGQYMHEHRIQADGQVRDSDNWQKGIPQDAYMKSAFRHFMDWWGHHRGEKVYDFENTEVDIEDALCALIFNAQGYLHEILKQKSEYPRMETSEGVPLGPKLEPQTWVEGLRPLRPG